MKKNPEGWERESGNEKRCGKNMPATLVTVHTLGWAYRQQEARKEKTGMGRRIT